MVNVAETNCRKCCGPPGVPGDCLYPDGSCKPLCCCLPPEHPLSCVGSPLCSDAYWGGGGIPSNDDCCAQPNTEGVTLPDNPVQRFIYVIGSYYYTRTVLGCTRTDKAYQAFLVDGTQSNISICNWIAHTIAVPSVQSQSGSCLPLIPQSLTLGGGVRSYYEVSGSFGQPSGGALPVVNFFAVATCEGIEWHVFRGNTTGVWESTESVRTGFSEQGVQSASMTYTATHSNPQGSFLLNVEISVVGGPSVLCPGWAPCQNGGEFPGKDVNSDCPPIPDPPPPGDGPLPDPPVNPDPVCPPPCKGDFPNCYQDVPVQLPNGGRCLVKGPCGGIGLVGQGNCPVGCVEVDDKCFKVLSVSPPLLTPCNPLSLPGDICGFVIDAGSGLAIPNTSLITPGTSILPVSSTPDGLGVGGGGGCGGCLSGGGM